MKIDISKLTESELIELRSEIDVYLNYISEIRRMSNRVICRPAMYMHISYMRYDFDKALSRFEKHETWQNHAMVISRALAKTQMRYSQARRGGSFD